MICTVIRKINVGLHHFTISEVLPVINFFKLKFKKDYQQKSKSGAEVEIEIISSPPN